MKKIMLAVATLVLGCLAVEAGDLLSLGIYFTGGSVELVSQTPKVAYRSKNVPGKNGWTSFPCYINIDKPQSVELTFKATGDLTFYASLYAFRRPGHKIIPLQCDKFEYNGKPIRVPKVITGWKRILTRNLEDGSTFTIKLELSKPEE